MKLLIDPTKNNSSRIEVSLCLKDRKESIDVAANRQQAEKLLPVIDKLLKRTKTELKQIKTIAVVNQGSSFTALRIGVATANALGYALGIPVEPSQEDDLIRSEDVKKTKGFSIVKPRYGSEPNITEKKKTL